MMTTQICRSSSEEEEIWKQIPSLPEYEASSLGRIRLIPTTVPCKGGVRRAGGKPITGSWAAGQQRYIYKVRRYNKNYKIARLVCEAFHGPPTEGRTDCMHLDENPRNNRPENLRWGTRKENLNMPGIKDYHRNACRQKMTGHSVTDLPRSYAKRRNA